MREPNEKLQWTLTFQVYHSPTYGHKLLLCTERGLYGDPHWKSLGSWKGLGIPEDVLTEARSSVMARIDEYLVTRYGVQGELPMKWAGEPDPF